MAIKPPDPPITPDPTDLQEHHAPELELQLLRHGLVEMVAHRMSCSRCGRSPLVGERLHVFAATGGEQKICDLCLDEARKGHLGEPTRVERVGAGERRLNVRAAA
jgi:hypothetical protein